MNTKESPSPIDTSSGPVQAQRIDYNGHMSEAFYVLVFGFATDAFYESIGAGEEFRTRNKCSIYTLEAHINYLQEVAEGVPLRVSTQLLDADQKRMRLFHNLYRSDTGEHLACTELMLLYVDMNTHRAATFPDELNTTITTLCKQHAQLPQPKAAGASISL